VKFIYQYYINVVLDRTPSVNQGIQTDDCKVI
jgi:hypothetical protein